MSVAVASRPDLLGREQPRLFTPPLRELTEETSLGFECIRFAENVLGLELLPWQRWFLIHALEIKLDGNFRFRTVVLLVGRQSGKTTISQVLTLWRMCVDGARTVLATAQNLDVANRTVAEVQQIVEATPELASMFEKDGRAGGKFWFQVKIPTEHSEQVCEMRAVTADRKGARSMTADLVFADELREHQSWEGWNAIEATISTRSRGMILATSNAGDSKSVVLKALREQGLAAIREKDDGTITGLFEWSAPEGCALDDMDGWAQALPGLGVTSIIDDVRAAASRPGNENGFRTERLCQWVEQIEIGPFGETGWRDAHDPDSRIAEGSPVTLAVDISYDRQYGCLAVAGHREDGGVHVEVLTHRAGTEWIVDLVAEKIDQIGAESVVLQGRGAPASALRPLFEARGIAVTPCEGPGLSAAPGMFYDAVLARRLWHHTENTVLDVAAEQAAINPAGDTWLWDRRKSPVDVSPLCAVTFAAWALAQQPKTKPVSAYVAQADEDDYRWW